MLIYFHGKQRCLQWQNIIIFSCLIYLAISLVLLPSIMTLSLFSITIITYCISSRSYWPKTLPQIVRSWLIFINITFNTWLCSIPILKTPMRRGIFQYKPHIKLIPWLIPIFFGAMFIALFINANPIYEKMYDIIEGYIYGFFIDAIQYITPIRILFWIMVWMITYPLFSVRILKRKNIAKAKDQGEITDGKNSFLLKTNVLLVCLVLFNLIFLLQTICDIQYLWNSNELPEGMTYANYAHRGAYPLVFTALLAGLFVMFSYRRGLQSQQITTHKIILLFLYLWIFQNVFLIINAGYRLALYVNAYSLTRWRIAAALWMLLVTLGLITLIYKIMNNKSNYWLTGKCVWYFYFLLLLISPVNIDRYIAMYNVNTCSEITGKNANIDIGYLTSLGIHALPAMQWLANQSSDPKIRVTLQASINKQSENLINSLADWRTWSYYKQQILNTTRIQLPSDIDRMTTADYDGIVNSEQAMHRHEGD
ncbi:DUF4153 domain-containing protein [Poriferisphaera corsica]